MCPTLCDPIDGSPPGSPIPGILQASTLEWVAIPFSNKDLEELKNKHTETNNTITEIKNALEGTNSGISETEEQTSELEDKIVEITSEEQNKVKRLKRTEDSLRDLWTISNAPTFELKLSQKKRENIGYKKNF